MWRAVVVQATNHHGADRDQQAHPPQVQPLLQRRVSQPGLAMPGAQRLPGQARRKTSAMKWAGWDNVKHAGAQGARLGWGSETVMARKKKGQALAAWRRPGVCPGRRAHQQHGHRGGARDLLGIAAHQHAGEATAPVGCQRDQVGAWALTCSATRSATRASKVSISTVSAGTPLCATRSWAQQQQNPRPPGAGGQHLLAVHLGPLKPLMWATGSITFSQANAPARGLEARKPRSRRGRRWGCRQRQRGGVGNSWRRALGARWLGRRCDRIVTRPAVARGVQRAVTVVSSSLAFDQLHVAWGNGWCAQH